LIFEGKPERQQLDGLILGRYSETTTVVEFIHTETTMAESSMKRLKAAVEEENHGGGTDETDKFSTLPNSVLCHILSLPPIKTAISMSLVSRRWLQNQRCNPNEC
jgi:hypothetical protein